MKVIYKITYPNGKIYVGRDSTCSNLFYYGSPVHKYIEKDFTWEQQQDITLQKQILFSSETISDSEWTLPQAVYKVKQLYLNNIH